MAWKRLIVFFSFCFYISISHAEEFIFKKIINLNDPWGSTFISNENLLITEKSGKIKLINLNTKKILNVSHNLNVLEHGQGGLLDIIYQISLKNLLRIKRYLLVISPMITLLKD